MEDFKVGDICYLYYNGANPIRKVRVDNIDEQTYEVAWLEHSIIFNREVEVGGSIVPKSMLFESQDACKEYARVQTETSRENIRGRLGSIEDLLNFMNSLIYCEDCDFSDEKAVIKERCKELLGVDLK